MDKPFTTGEGERTRTACQTLRLGEGFRVGEWTLRMDQFRPYPRASIDTPGGVRRYVGLCPGISFPLGEARIVCTDLTHQGRRRARLLITAAIGLAIVELPRTDGVEHRPGGRTTDRIDAMDTKTLYIRVDKPLHAWVCERAWASRQSQTEWVRNVLLALQQRHAEAVTEDRPPDLRMVCPSCGTSPPESP